jgi:predicted phosphodiesterase
MRIVCLADSHLTHDEYTGVSGELPWPMPEGDMIIHAGDWTFRGRPHEIFQFGRWFNGLPYTYRVCVAGNHDLGMEDAPGRSKKILFGLDEEYFAEPKRNGIIYLQDEEVNIEGLRIYGAPWSPRFFDWAFNASRGPEIKAKWDMIPEGIDILITHGPPFGYGDETLRGDRVGCEELIKALDRVKPRLLICGHIHPGYGKYRYKNTTIINAAMCDETYYPTNPPIVVDL